MLDSLVAWFSARLVGVLLVPVPVSATVSGLLVALPLTVTLPVRVPVAVGVLMYD